MGFFARLRGKSWARCVDQGAGLNEGPLKSEGTLGFSKFLGPGPGSMMVSRPVFGYISLGCLEASHESTLALSPLGVPQSLLWALAHLTAGNVIIWEWKRF